MSITGRKRVKSTVTKKGRKHVKIELDAPERTDLSNFGFGELTEENILSYASKTNVPANWHRTYAAIAEMRTSGVAKDAPVDSIGCAMLGDKDVEPKVFRFHILVSLMLSSQTKDATTAAAVGNLKRGLDGGLTPQSVQNATELEVDGMISKTGFHKRKASYLKRTSDILLSDYDGDIPSTVKDLCKLPGVGPKMAHLAMQEAWKNTVGIGVDVHVHRITNTLRWVKTKTPEKSRTELEKWLPRHLWGPTNQLLVGFGQKICSAKKPKCSQCTAAEWCPVGRKLVKKVKKDGVKEENVKSKYFEATDNPNSKTSSSSSIRTKTDSQKHDGAKQKPKRKAGHGVNTKSLAIKKTRIQPTRRTRSVVKRYTA